MIALFCIFNRVVPDSCFNVCKGQWRRIHWRSILIKLSRLGRSNVTTEIRFDWDIFFTKRILCNDIL